MPLLPEYKIPIPPVSLKNALTDIIESIAVEESALGEILSAESRLLEKFKQISKDSAELLYANASVNSVARSITTLQMFNRYQLEDTENLLHKIIDSGEAEETEE